MTDYKSMKIEDLVLNQLLNNLKYFCRIIPFTKEEYFEGLVEKKIVSHIIDHFGKYDAKIPDVNVLRVLLESDTNCSESTYTDALRYITEKMETPLSINDIDEPWIYDTTEKLYRDRSVYNAILKSINILEGREKGLSKDILPELLEEALAVSFDSDNIGHQYFENAEERYENLHNSCAKFPCSLEAVNKITNQGFEESTLNLIVGSVGCILPSTKIRVRMRPKS